MEPELPPIIVEGNGFSLANNFWWWGWNRYGASFGNASSWSVFNGEYVHDSSAAPPPPPDEAKIEVINNLGRPYTASEQKVVNKLAIAIEKTTVAINKFANDARVQLRDGSVVTGVELKEIWAKADFQIDPTGTEYENGATRGEADYNFGNPNISLPFNIIEE